MTAPLTREQVEALAGFTPGPWATDDLGRIVRGSKPVCDYVPRATRPLIAAAPDLHATCLHLLDEVARLTAELAEERKPLADAWRSDRDARGPFWWRPGCMTSKVRGEGRRERDLELVAAGWCLVGGVFGEVSDG